jgi:hypothetical protein
MPGGSAVWDAEDAQLDVGVRTEIAQRRQLLGFAFGSAAR